MELPDYIRVLRRRWLLIVFVTLVGLGAAATYSLLQTPQYQAQSRVYVSTDSAADVAELGQGTTYTQQIVQSFVEVSTTARVLEPVIEELGLDASPQGLAQQIDVTHQNNTVLLSIIVTDQDAVAAAEIADAVTDSLIDTVGDITPETADGQNPIAVTTLEAASVSPTPVSPRVPLNLALGLIFGLALGVGIAILRETLDTRVRGEHDLENITEAPIIGGMAYDPTAKSRPLVVQGDPKGGRAESFRALRTNLQFLEIGEKSRSFVVTSSVPGEGKSTTTANLAITMREAGHRVLCVDADLRRSKIAKYFGLEGAVGLTDVLVGNAELEDVIQHWGPHGLAVLPAGKMPPNPSEILGSRAMQTLLERFKQHFDVVLLDSPPLLPVTDAAILSTRVTGAIVVVASGKTHRQQLEGAVDTLSNVGAKLLGVVLTMLPTRGPDAYRYGRYGHNYSYEEAGKP